MPSVAQELRFAFTFDDVDHAVHLFRDVFGLELEEEFVEGEARGFIFKVPSATLELFDRGYARHVDEVEVGRPFGARARIAVRVNDITDIADQVSSAGFRSGSGPVETPWGDRNQRFEVSEDLQLTLFQVVGGT